LDQLILQGIGIRIDLQRGWNRFYREIELIWQIEKKEKEKGKKEKEKKILTWQGWS